MGHDFCSDHVGSAATGLDPANHVITLGTSACSFLTVICQLFPRSIVPSSSYRWIPLSSKEEAAKAQPHRASNEEVVGLKSSL